MEGWDEKNVREEKKRRKSRHVVSRKSGTGIDGKGR